MLKGNVTKPKHRLLLPFLFRPSVLVPMGMLLAILVFALSDRSSASPEGKSAVGKELYEQFCAACHGPEGRGDGPAAVYLLPKPRDFTRGIFKLRSTPTGSLPTDEDLLAILTRGMPGSGMPSFSFLSPEKRRVLADYIKEFYVAERNRLFETDTIRWMVGTQVRVVKEPPITAASLAEGKIWYENLECFKCHGTGGKGDGPSAPGLKDMWGYSAPVRDFTRGDYKGGNSNKDLYLRFTTGMDGSPMPSYATGTIGDADRWKLAHYVQSLRTKALATAPLPKEGIVVARRVEPEISPGNPAAPFWGKIAPVGLPLNDLWMKTGVLRTAKLRAAYNDRQLAILLEWNDPKADQSSFKITQFRDGAAIQFALDTTEIFLGMGDSVTPVNIWHWKADWQAKAPLSRHVVSNDKNSDYDFYFFQAGEFQEATFLTGRAAGNPFSDFSPPSPVEDLNARGFGTITSQDTAGQNVSGWGIYQEGKWKVVFVRPLQSADEGDAEFTAGRPVPFAVAVWDGSGGDRAAQKAVSNWYRLILERR